LANRLENEDSPYLQQHKDNPVEWFPWCEEAFQKAKDERKSIFVSIGYSSCHWCHVMEHESFENDKIAELLNRDFVSIKVDREERPDLDKYYQDLYHLVHKKGGGWPLSVFLTHEKKPFHLDTYIPPHHKYGKMGMVELLSAIVEMYQNDFERLEKTSSQLDLIGNTLSPKAYREIDDGYREKFVSHMKQRFDFKLGGFSKAPKFPQIAGLKTLTLFGEYYMVDKTLREMTKGGLYDVVDGGFCRYSVDEKWFVPHFEKMLYDNSLLIELLSERFLENGDKTFRDIAVQTANFLIQKMSLNGLFFSASDADSDGKEGTYFIFSFDELREKISEEKMKLLSISKEGNFEGKNIIRIEKRNFHEFGEELKILREIRSNREYPFIDKKIILSWNSMTIKGLFKLSTFEESFREIAKSSLEKLLENLYIDGKIYHSRLINGTPKIEAFLEDYGYLSDLLIEAYQIFGDEKYLNLLKEIVEKGIKLFYREERWFFSADNEFISEAEAEDSSYPSSLGKFLISLYKSALLFDNLEFFSIFEKSIQQQYGNFLRYPSAFATLGEAIHIYKKELLIIKSNKDNLVKLAINSDQFITKISDIENFDICGIGNCFQSVKTPEEVYDFLKNN
jgi:hypothetical protein